MTGLLRREEGVLAGARGVSIRHRAWLPDTQPAGVVVIVHGFAEHGGRYEHLARRLVGAEYAVRAADHRGHGRSGGRRTSVVRFADYITDLLAVIRLSHRQWPGVPMFVLGHSFGGLVALATALTDAANVTGLVLSAPAACPGRVSKVTVAAGRVLARVAPEAPVLKLPLRSISRDPAVVAAYLADPLVFPTRMRARLGVETLATIEAVQRDLPSLRMPLLVMQGSEDGVVDPACGPGVYERAGSSDKTLRIYEGLWHEIFNEPERERVIDELLAWLEQHVRATSTT